jgi:nitrous-oxide reductase
MSLKENSKGKNIAVMASLIIAVIALVVGVGTLYMQNKVIAGTNTSQKPQTREFIVVTGSAGFNETQVGIPHDIYIPNRIIVNQGDKVIVHFYNVDTEHHTFTIGAPYNINVDLAGGQHQDITFVAEYPGVYTFYCIYHLPTMTGELVVLPSQ